MGLKAFYDKLGPCVNNCNINIALFNIIFLLRLDIYNTIYTWPPLIPSNPEENK